jgi:diadenosine tetraphosphatase ApaH/serine/threonine PP2A family protein phosphatase
VRFAAIADVHGNHLALEAVLGDIASLGIRDVVNLGDALSGPLDAARTADLLLLLDADAVHSVRGNHDRYLIETPADRLQPSDAHAHGQLGERHFAWLRKLPFDSVFRNEVYLCHATPKDDNLYWLEKVTAEGCVTLRPQAEIEAMAEGIEQSLLLCAHSHVARMVQLSDGRLIVNPGSVGCPAYDDDAPYPHKVEVGHPRACYAILDKTEAGWAPTFRTVAYDHMAMARLGAKNGRPDWASALATGWAG